MGLKKFSDFVIKETCEKPKPKKEVKKHVKSKKKENDKSLKESIIPKKTVLDKSHNNNEICERIENVVNFLRITKPSDSFKFLNEYDSYKDVHYVMSEQPNNSISIFKYNQNEGVNIKEFADSLFTHYRKNNVLNKVLENSVIEGNDLFVIFKNLPDSKFKNIVKNDIIKLLKNK